MAHLLVMTVSMLVAAPSAGPTADATSLPKPAAMVTPAPTPVEELDSSRSSETPGLSPRSTPLPEDISSHPAWERYFRGKKLHGIGQALTITGGVLAGIFVLATPLAVVQHMGHEVAPFKGVLAMSVGFGVPIVVLFYCGISLLVKGGRMVDRAVIEIFGPPDPTRPSIRVELGPGGLGLRGRF